MSQFAKIIDPTGPKAIVLVRIAVGAIFTSEGIQKFLYPDSLGAGRFAKIGIPAPEVLGPFVGVVEIICGLVILAGLLTRLAAIPLIIDMLVAIASTKVPILLGRGYFLFAKPSVAKTGFWSMLHEARTDLAMSDMTSSTLSWASRLGPKISTSRRLSIFPSSIRKRRMNITYSHCQNQLLPCWTSHHRNGTR